MDFFDFDAYQNAEVGQDALNAEQQTPTFQAPGALSRTATADPEHVTVQEQAPIVRQQANNLFNRVNQPHGLSAAAINVPNYLSFGTDMELFPPEIAPAARGRHIQVRSRCPSCGHTFNTYGPIEGFHQHTCGCYGSGLMWRHYEELPEVNSVEWIVEQNRPRREQYWTEMLQSQQQAAQLGVPNRSYGFSSMQTASAPPMQPPYMQQQYAPFRTGESLRMPQSPGGHQDSLKRKQPEKLEYPPQSAHQHQLARDQRRSLVPSQSSNGHLQNRGLSRRPDTPASVVLPQHSLQPSTFGNDVPQTFRAPLHRQQSSHSSSMAFDGRDNRRDSLTSNKTSSKATSAANSKIRSLSRNPIRECPPSKRRCTRAPNSLPPTLGESRGPAQEYAAATAQRLTGQTPSNASRMNCQSCASGRPKLPTVSVTPPSSTTSMLNSLNASLPSHLRATVSRAQAKIHTSSTPAAKAPPITLDNLEFHLRAEIDRMCEQESKRQGSADPSLAQTQPPPKQSRPLVQGPVTYLENFDACYRDEIERVKRGGSGQNPDPLMHASDQQWQLVREKWTNGLMTEVGGGRYVSAENLMRSAVGYHGPRDPPSGR